MSYTNSKLASYIKLSPNHSGQRTKAIDQIAIHYSGGVASVETLAAAFQKGKTSVNYVIGNDGRIGLIVEEKNRSWATSSAAVDQRAVTIMVSNSTNKDPWPVSDEAWDALIDLCTDICKRNDIKKLLWKNDKNLLNKVDQQNMVAHCHVINTTCPGKFLLGKFGVIAEKVNANLATTDETIRDTTLDNNSVTNEEVIWKFFMSKIGNAFGVAGLMGNLYAESGLIPNNLQNSCSKRLGLSDAEYTLQVDNDAYTNFVKDQCGYGLAQWTWWSRKQNLLVAAKAANVSIGNLQMQLDFLWKELQTDYASTLTVLKSATSVREASNVVLMKFEQPADQSETVQIRRASYGLVYYDKFVTESIAKKTFTDIIKTGSSLLLTAIINAAIKEIGVTEWPADSNNVKYNTGFYGHQVSGSSYPWCMAFIQWIFKKAGKALPYKTAGCLDLWNWYYKNARSRCKTSNPKPGDIIIFVRNAAKGTGHTGLVVEVKNGKIYTIEGNTSSAVAFEANGGAVAKKSYIIGAIPNLKGFITPYDYDQSSTTVTVTGTVVSYKAVVTSALNYRIGPGTNFTAKGVLAKGTIVNVIGEIESGAKKWAKLDNGTWCSAAYLQKI